MALRNYQQRAVAAIRAALSRHRSIVLSMQVGSGKTSVACEIIRRVTERGKRAMFVVHRVELVEQARDRLREFGIEAGIIKAGYRERRQLPVQVACVPTLIRREFPPADIVILDECHHTVSNSWLKIVEHYRVGSFILGITATPLRLDGKPLGEAFDEIIEPVSTPELVAAGWLIPPTVFAPPLDRANIPKRGGDFSLPELAERVSPLCGHVVNTWLKHGRGKRTVAFAVNIAHSRLIEAAFRAVGVRVAHIDGKSTARERKRIGELLKAHELDVVTQCQLWTEGVDIPELECLSIVRPTESLSLHRQMIGRVMRPSPGKTQALVLDHAGNHHVHGSILDPVEWSLEGVARRVSATEPLRTCPECYAVFPPGAEICPACGAPLTGRETQDPPGIEGPGELVRLDLASPARAGATMQEKQVEYRNLLRIASEREYRIGWAKMRYKDAFGVWPRFRMLEQTEYRCSGHEWEEREYGGWRRVLKCVRCHEEKASA